jgi:hypothetical protein
MGAGQVLCFVAHFTAVSAGKLHERANIIEREAELSRTANKPQARNILIIIAAIPAAQSARLRQQANPLVIADRLDIALRAVGQFPDRDFHGAAKNVVVSVATTDRRVGFLGTQGQRGTDQIGEDNNIVRLSHAERNELVSLVRSGKLREVLTIPRVGAGQ